MVEHPLFHIDYMTISRTATTVGSLKSNLLHLGKRLSIPLENSSCHFMVYQEKIHYVQLNMQHVHIGSMDSL